MAVDLGAELIVRKPANPKLVERFKTLLLPAAVEIAEDNLKKSGADLPPRYLGPFTP
jgi:hypothetical protein